MPALGSDTSDSRHSSVATLGASAGSTPAQSFPRAWADQGFVDLIAAVSTRAGGFAVCSDHSQSHGQEWDLSLQQLVQQAMDNVAPTRVRGA